MKVYSILTVEYQPEAFENHAMAFNNMLPWNQVHQEVLLRNHLRCRGAIPYTLPYMCYDLLSS